MYFGNPDVDWSTEMLVKMKEAMKSVTLTPLNEDGCGVFEPITTSFPKD